tara:strand:+ start:26 stop:775 length:750 start_codon:yes stop_codon:yes gene_type:complete
MGAPIYQMGNMGSSVNSKKEENKSGTIENEMSKTETSNKVSAAEKERLNTKTKDTEAKTVKQGKLSRKQAVKTAKNSARATRDAKLDKPNMDLEGAVGKRKEARATKRQEMQDIRNEERGARRADRAARKIKRIGDRNNMTVGEATKAYEARYGKGGALSDFQKGERNAKPTDAQSNNDQKGKDVKEQNDQIQIDNVTATIGNNTPDINNPEVVSGIGKMLDGPTQQAASEDSSGMGTYMLDSKNRRGR